MAFGAPEKKIEAADERRIAARYKAAVEVWADPGGTANAVACKILDISKTGAKISVEEPARLPDDFILHSAGVKYLAHVVWRRQKQVGIEFIDSQT